MIENLAHPAVVVVDDEEEDYRPILTALSQLFIGCVHFAGDDISVLPPKPFTGVRLVFMDLHLANTIGKDAAARAANVFQKIVDPMSPPVVVVVWSKYADDRVPNGEGEETEADLFQRTLLDAEGRYRNNLIFLKMAKPKASERPDKWISGLKESIASVLEERRGLALLWNWEAMVTAATTSVMQGLSELTHPLKSSGGVPLGVDAGLEAILRLLGAAQAEGDKSIETVPGHLITILDQLLADFIQHGRGALAVDAHAKWLIEDTDVTKSNATLPAKVNAFLLTSQKHPGAKAFLPGTVYECVDDEAFLSAFGCKVDALLAECVNKDSIERLRSTCRIVLVELSPDCDVAQNKRQMALLLAGLIIPSTEKGALKSGDALQALPKFALRWSGKGFKEQDAILIFGSRFKLTVRPSNVPAWLSPWFRIRDLPTASLRNWHSGHAARIGYVSVA